jgi:putative ABC transport system permease protein
LGEDIKVIKFSSEYDFSGILTKKDLNTPVSLTVVDSNYPIYGGLSIKNSSFQTPKDNKIYIDTNAEEKLNIKVGEDLVYANTVFTVAGIIEKDSKFLVSGFNFLPKVLLSERGFKRVNIDKSLLRSEYTYVYLIENTSDANLREMVSRAGDIGARISVVGITESGLVEGLSLVKQFLILAVLLSCILSAVNIYAGMLYLLTAMRKSFAILLAIGFDKKKLAITLSLSLFYILVFATIIGGFSSIFLFNFILEKIAQNFDLALPFVDLLLPSLFTILVVFGISFASFVPSLRNLMSLNPKILLSGGEEKKQKNRLTNFIIITFSSLVPLVLIAVFLLESFLYGFISILAIVLIYVVLAVLFYYLILALYKKRHKFKFMIRSLISYKFADGLFGIVSLTSLYVALTSLSLLILLQSTLTNFIKDGLGERLPSVYVIDIQKSQKDAIKENFKEVTLFPNVGARILSIDSLDIQKGVALSDGSVSREFGREYNLTYRSDLLPSETVIKGDWLTGQINEVSVDKDFADRANIKLGSSVVFSVSGFEIKSTVTSIRESDTRSGLPFFYFVFNPKDLEKYPATFFGYTYLDETEKGKFTNFLAESFTNISVIDTSEISKLAENLVGGLLVIIYVISLPPLILASFLIITLIISSFSGRRKQSAQLLALGAKNTFIKKLYYLETVSTTLFSGVLGYLTAIIGTLFIAKYFLKIKDIVFYDIELIATIGCIILFVLVLANILWRTEKKSLRELLSYEEH